MYQIINLFSGLNNKVTKSRNFLICYNSKFTLISKEILTNKVQEESRTEIDPKCFESFGNGMIGYRFDIAQETKTSPKEVTDSNPLNRIVDFLALISRLIVGKTQGFGGATGGGGGGFCGGAGSGRH